MENQAGESFFLPIAHWQLGEKDKPREWFKKAVHWMEKRGEDESHLKRFRTEAARLLLEKCPDVT